MKSILRFRIPEAAREKLKILGMPPRRLPRAGKVVLYKTNVVFCHFFISPIFNFVTVNDRYKNSPEGFFSIFS